jgi:DNA-binding MarR family transcriptional regulator
MPSIPKMTSKKPNGDSGSSRSKQPAVTSQNGNQSVGELLLAFRRKISCSTKKELLDRELTFSQIETLMFIGLKGSKSMESIASHLDIAPPSATSLVEKLEKKGLIVRFKDSQDRRMVLIELSAQAKKQISKMWKSKEQVLEKLIAKLNAADRNHFERIMKILIQD